jgi:hypothetical protein
MCYRIFRNVRYGLGAHGALRPCFPGSLTRKLYRKKITEMALNVPQVPPGCRAGIRTDGRAQSNDGEGTMKPVFDTQDNEAYRIIPDSNAIIHDMAGQAAGAGPVVGREPGVDG